MTNQEAIEKLVNAEFADKYQGDQDLTTAMLMAIDVLKYGPVHSRYCPACGAKIDGGAGND